MRVQNHAIFRFLVCVLFVSAVPSVNAADRFSVASGNWSDVSTWSATRGGLPGASVPGPTDNVFIDDGYTVSVDLSDAVCYSVTVGQGLSGILNMGRTTTQPTSQALTVIADLTVNPGARIIPRRNNQNHMLTVGGNISNHGIIKLTSDTRNGPVCSVFMNGSGSQSVGGTAPVQFNDLTIESNSITSFNTSGQTVKGVLLVDGILDPEGNLTILSDQDGTGLIDGNGIGQITGPLTMQQYLSEGIGYKYLSSPFQDATIAELGDDTDLAADFPVCFRYDESQTGPGWISYTVPEDVLNILSGYAVNFGADVSPKTIDISGVPADGNNSITLYNHNNDKTNGFNLVGNPYPSPIDWDAAGWTKVNIDNAIYRFSASTTDQYGGTYSTYINGVSSDGVTTNIIPSMQGFFVRVTDGAYPVTATLGVTNSVRTNDKKPVFLKSATAAGRFLVRAAASFADDTASTDMQVIYFDENASTGFDSEFDALKLFNTDMQVTNFYSVLENDTKLSICALPPQPEEEMTVPLGLVTSRAGEVCFNIQAIENKPETVSILFKDAYAGTSIDISQIGEYRVTLPAGKYDDRFSMVFLKNATGTETPEFDPDILTVYTTDNMIVAEVNDTEARFGTITVYDISGRTIFQRDVYGPGRNMFNLNGVPGIYLIQYVSGRRQIVRKLIAGK